MLVLLSAAAAAARGKRLAHIVRQAPLPRWRSRYDDNIEILYKEWQPLSLIEMGALAQDDFVKNFVEEPHALYQTLEARMLEKRKSLGSIPAGHTPAMLRD